MAIVDRLYRCMAEKAEGKTVEMLSVGLGYTAVATSDGGIGLAYTALEGKHGCSVVGPDSHFEGGPALDLLTEITADHPVHRSMALALVNALNHGEALALPEDRSNDLLFEQLGIPGAHRIAMVGFFQPLIARLKQLGTTVEVIDTGRNIGNPVDFTDKLRHWADAVILTSTAILNGTADDLLAAVRPQARVVMIGPSTPLVAEAFADLPVHVLAGTVPVQRDATFQAIRHGKGTPALQKFGRKVYRILKA